MVWSGNKAPNTDDEDVKNLALWVEDEFERFANEQIDNLQALELRPSYNAPLRPQQGMIVYPDAVKFVPGAPNYGAGPYYRTASGLWAPMFGRPRLVAAQDFYVRTDGNDTNTGTSNTAGGAWLTLQHAVDEILKIDAGGQNVTLHVAAGTYAGFDMLSPVPGLGNGTFLVTGDITTPTNVIINSSANGNAIGCFGGAQLSVSGLSLRPTNIFVCLQAGIASQIICVDKMDFGNAVYHLEAQNGGAVYASGISYTISGSPTTAHVRPNNLGYIDTAFSTVTLTANITCTSFGFSELNSVYKCNAMTFNLGAFAVTGKKFDVKNGAVINTATGNVNYFPGSLAGTGTNFGVAPWGLYL